ncbi:three-helix bundle dimerization domain-containing protein [Arthrobacter sp. R4]
MTNEPEVRDYVPLLVERAARLRLSRPGRLR